MPIVPKSGGLSFLEPSGPIQACNGIALRFELVQVIPVASLPFTFDWTVSAVRTGEPWGTKWAKICELQQHSMVTRLWDGCQI